MNSREARDAQLPRRGSRVGGERKALGAREPRVLPATLLRLSLGLAVLAQLGTCCGSEVTLRRGHGWLGGGSRGREQE